MVSDWRNEVESDLASSSSDSDADPDYTFNASEAMVDSEEYSSDHEATTSGQLTGKF
jgi:hypothetical protein